MINIIKKIFSKKETQFDLYQIKLALTPEDKELINKFRVKQSNDRIRDIMILADTGNLKFFKLLQYAILFDDDTNVKFAALKRIHNFKEHPDLEPMLTDMRTNKIDNKLEPYFSMALNRVGLSSNEEFEKIINTAAN